MGALFHSHRATVPEEPRSRSRADDSNALSGGSLPKQDRLLPDNPDD